MQDDWLDGIRRRPIEEHVADRLPGSVSNQGSGQLVRRNAACGATTDLEGHAESCAMLGLVRALDEDGEAPGGGAPSASTARLSANWIVRQLLHANVARKRAFFPARAGRNEHLGLAGLDDARERRREEWNGGQGGKKPAG
jgi:hypothetical protein